MNNADLITLVDSLRVHGKEQEWVEFKANNADPQLLGRNLSAVANAACFRRQEYGYVVFGIQNSDQAVVGTSFDPEKTKAKGNQDLPIYLATGLTHGGCVHHKVSYPDGDVVLFRIKAASGEPVKFLGAAYIRVGTSTTQLDQHPDRARAIWMSRNDWSSQICSGATLQDLDDDAVEKARLEYKKKHPAQEAEVDSWDLRTFLNKAKVTVRGEVTTSALLLLGKPETAALLSPCVANITWVLKDKDNQEIDGKPLGPPFILAGDELLTKIRNLTLRELPGGTLFPQEMSQYDPWVIREALHNCIAHQDYALAARIQVVETPDALLFTNAGSFLPGSVAQVIEQDAPWDVYRNPFLANAMVNLNMIETLGSGVKRMFRLQARRSLPMPDYVLGRGDRVSVTIPGKVLDERYTRLLMQRTDLPLETIILLDRVQRHREIAKEDHVRLKNAALVEGRYPNLLIAGPLAKLTGQSARHVRHRGMNKQYYLDLILELIESHAPVSRREVDDLLLDKLPEILTPAQKKVMVHNLLAELQRKALIQNRGSRRASAWHSGTGKN